MNAVRGDEVKERDDDFLLEVVGAKSIYPRYYIYRLDNDNGCGSPVIY